MKKFLTSALIALCVSHSAFAAECASGPNRAGCTGPNGAVGYNKNTGEAGSYNRNTGVSHTTQPGVHCAVVNGARVCN